MGKNDAKFEEGIFLGYSSTSKAYKVYNHKTLVIEESMHVVFEESKPFVLPKKDSVDVVLHRLNLSKHEENNIVKDDQREKYLVMTQ